VTHLIQPQMQGRWSSERTTRAVPLH